MKRTSAWVAVFVVILHIKYALTLQVIPERAMMTTFNDKYLHNATIFIKRNGRKSAYFFNLQAATKKIFGNDMTLHLVFYELLHNEYKRSFVELHFKFCDMINKDPYIGATFAKAGLTCPVPVGYYKLMNMSVPLESFPNVWPFERCKVEAWMTHSPTNDVVASADIFVLFKQKPQIG